jgi:hypothetical protein
VGGGYTILKATCQISKSGCSDSGGYVKFTPKYIIVGDEGVVSEFF